MGPIKRTLSFQGTESPLVEGRYRGMIMLGTKRRHEDGILVTYFCGKPCSVYQVRDRVNRSTLWALAPQNGPNCAHQIEPQSSNTFIPGTYVLVCCSRLVSGAPFSIFTGSLAKSIGCTLVRDTTEYGLYPQRYIVAFVGRSDSYNS